MLCDKAGLPRSAWRQGDVEVLVYQVERFEEARRHDAHAGPA
jgi:AMMECR1 domain-containing protein